MAKQRRNPVSAKGSKRTKSPPAAARNKRVSRAAAAPSPAGKSRAKPKAVVAVRAAPTGGRGAANAAGPIRLPRDPKGRRAQFYQDPAIDQLWAVVAALTGEVSVAFDRLDTFERVLERHGYVTRAAIEAYRPDDTASAERSRRREELIQRVFQVLSQYAI
jgi:hypothetical protein